MFPFFSAQITTLVHLVSSCIVRSQRLYLRSNIWMFMENNAVTGKSLIDDWNQFFILWNIPFSCTIWPFRLITIVRWNRRPCEILRTLENPNSDSLKPLQPSAINHQPSTMNPSRPCRGWLAKLLRTKKSRAWMMFGCRLRSFGKFLTGTSCVSFNVSLTWDRREIYELCSMGLNYLVHMFPHQI